MTFVEQFVDNCSLAFDMFDDIIPFVKIYRSFLGMF